MEIEIRDLHVTDLDPEESFVYSCEVRQGESGWVRFYFETEPWPHREVVLRVVLDLWRAYCRKEGLV